MTLFPATLLLLWAGSAPCDQLQPCLAALAAVANDRPGIDKEEQSVARSLQRQGRAAVAPLMKLLDSPSNAVRTLAAYTLRDLDGLTDAEVPALARALAAGGGGEWVAPALARIGTPSAVEALGATLARRPERDNQVTYAFELLGARGVPVLLRAFRCGERPPCDDALLATVQSIFRGLKAAGSGAVAPLTAIVTDERQPERVRLAAIGSLGAIGPSALSAAPALERLAAASPGSYGKPVLAALQGMKSPVAARALAERLAKEGDPMILRGLAEMGEGAREAGPAVVKALGHPDWEVREAAARTLGYIGYREGADALVAALGSQEDWQLVYAAAESLGRLGDVRFVPDLARVEKSHWYPPVRAAARKAQAVLQGRERYQSRWHRDNFALEFGEPAHVGHDLCPRVNGERRSFLPDDDLRRARAEVGTYDTVVVGYGAGPGGRPLREEHPRKQKPNAALAVPDGWLLGGDRGEWGGELVFRDQRRRVQRIHEDNVQALARLGDRIVALGGLSHLFRNRGVAYELVKDRAGQWSVRPWRLLPGAPNGSAPTPEGRWLIHTSGGSVLLAPDGSLSMAPCPPAH